MGKKRGIAAERELLHILWEQGYAVARVAGSGSVPEPSCDLLAGNGDSKYAIECKLSKKEKKYLSKEQVEEFLSFSLRFGLTPIIALKFVRKGWFFVHPDHLNKTPKGFVISLEEAREKTIKLIK